MNKNVYFILGGVAILGLGTFIFLKLKKKKEVSKEIVAPQIKTEYSADVINRINQLKQIIQSDQQKFNTYKTKRSRQNVQAEIDKNLAELNKLLNT